MESLNSSEGNNILNLKKVKLFDLLNAYHKPDEFAITKHNEPCLI